MIHEAQHGDIGGLFHLQPHPPFAKYYFVLQCFQGLVYFVVNRHILLEA